MAETLQTPVEQSLSHRTWEGHTGHAPETTQTLEDNVRSVMAFYDPGEVLPGELDGLVFDFTYRVDAYNTWAREWDDEAEYSRDVQVPLAELIEDGTYYDDVDWRSVRAATEDIVGEYIEQKRYLGGGANLT